MRAPASLINASGNVFTRNHSLHSGPVKPTIAEITRRGSAAITSS